MKRKTTIIMALSGFLSMQAMSHPQYPQEETKAYTYLTFETTDGAKASVVASSLTLTISGTTLKAGSQTFTLSNLNKMYFSTIDETTTSIGKVTDAMLEQATEIYDLQGHKVMKEQMRKGVYIVRTENRTYQIVVK